MVHKQYYTFGIYGILFIALYFVFFQHLDSFHIKNWDESMFAVNAYEMNNNNNFIVPFYKNLPDMWNSKPPLQLWFQVLFIKLIGYNELAIRLPSAIASSGSALLLFFFFKKRTSIILALCVFFVFISSGGVSSFHAGRTGDADALLSFFILCYCISFYKWIFEHKEKSIFFFFIFITLAFLTKSFAALLFLPAIIFSVFYFKKANSLIKNKWFYIGFIICLTVCIGFILLRESQNHGYINYIFKNDLNRINNVIEQHEEPFDFYFNNLFNYRFLWTIIVLPGALLLYLNEKIREYVVFGSLLIFCYFGIISLSITKLEWYDLPLFPLLSIPSAYTLFYIFSKSTNLHSTNRTILFFGFIFTIPCYFSFRNAYKSEISLIDKKLEVLTEFAFKNQKNNSLNQSVFYTTDYDRALCFYKYKQNEKGIDFSIERDIEKIRPNSVVIVSNDSLKSILKNRFECHIIDSVKSAIKFSVKSKK